MLCRTWFLDSQFKLRAAKELKSTSTGCCFVCFQSSASTYQAVKGLQRFDSTLAISGPTPSHGARMMDHCTQRCMEPQPLQLPLIHYTCVHPRATDIAPNLSMTRYILCYTTLYSTLLYSTILYSTYYIEPCQTTSLCSPTLPFGGPGPDLMLQHALQVVTGLQQRRASRNTAEIFREPDMAELRNRP